MNSLLEVNSGPTKVILTIGGENAIIYVCLTANVTSKNAKTDLRTEYRHGDVFGLVEDFNEVVDNPILFNLKDDGIGGVDQILDFAHGTYVRIELVDLYNQILKPLIAVRSQVEKEQAALEERCVDAEISEKAWEDMTEEDRFYVKGAGQCFLLQFHRLIQNDSQERIHALTYILP